MTVDYAERERQHKREQRAQALREGLGTVGFVFAGVIGLVLLATLIVVGLTMANNYAIERPACDELQAMSGEQRTYMWNLYSGCRMQLSDGTWVGYDVDTIQIR